MAGMSRQTNFRNGAGGSAPIANPAVAGSLLLTVETFLLFS